jgi:hypothetical protein
MKRKPCPNEAAHTDSPYGSYASTYDWAQMMLKTHVQKRCPGCGLWAIWEPKKTAGIAPLERDP